MSKPRGMSVARFLCFLDALAGDGWSLSQEALNDGYIRFLGPMEIQRMLEKNDLLFDTLFCPLTAVATQASLERLFLPDEEEHLRDAADELGICDPLAQAILDASDTGGRGKVSPLFAIVGIAQSIEGPRQRRAATMYMRMLRVLLRK